MEFEEAVELLALGRISLNAVSSQPVLIEPEVEEQDAERAGEIEGVLFDGYWGAEGWGFDSQGCALVGKDEEIAGEEEVHACADGKEETDGPQKTFLLDLYSFLRDEPERDDQDGDDE